jgi:hypothetical protein
MFPVSTAAFKDWLHIIGSNEGMLWKLTGAMRLRAHGAREQIELLTGVRAGVADGGCPGALLRVNPDDVAIVRPCISLSVQPRQPQAAVEVIPSSACFFSGRIKVYPDLEGLENQKFGWERHFRDSGG